MAPRRGPRRNPRLTGETPRCLNRFEREPGQRTSGSDLDPCGVLFAELRACADNLAGNNDLNASVLLSTRRSAVISERIGFAETLGCDRVWQQSLRNQELSDGVGALLRQFHVEI